MTKAEETILRRFETRVRQLVLEYGKLQEDHWQLLLENEEKDKQLEACRKEISDLGEEMARLKLAKMMRIEDDDLAAAKQRIDRLVRKIDKCISMLGV